MKMKMKLNKESFEGSADWKDELPVITKVINAQLRNMKAGLRLRTHETASGWTISGVIGGVVLDKTYCDPDLGVVDVLDTLDVFLRRWGMKVWNIDMDGDQFSWVLRTDNRCGK